MKLEQNKWSESARWDNVLEMSFSADLVLGFGKRQLLENSERFEEIRSFYPSADIVLCSTAGEIPDVEVFDDSIVITALQFERTVIKSRQISLKGNWTSDSGMERELTSLFPYENLEHVLLLSHGLNVNGARLIEGMKAELNHSVSIIGGLAGDRPDFVKSVVGLNEAPSENKMVAVREEIGEETMMTGFYSYGELGPDRQGNSCYLHNQTMTMTLLSE